MKFVLYTLCVSPHQLPLARELVKLLGEDEYRYVYQNDLDEERVNLGWKSEYPRWMVSADKNQKLLEECDVLMSGIRDVALFKKRSQAGKKTIYTSERWFKPINISLRGKILFAVSGRLRMLVPSYRKMVKGMMDLVRSDPGFMLYPTGIHAARDFSWLLGCTIERFDRVPGGRFYGRGAYLGKMRLWGYFVTPSAQGTRYQALGTNAPLRVLWVGRFLNWKHVDDLIKAAVIANVKVDLYGKGPEESRLKKMSDGMTNVTFHGPVPIAEVRDLMRLHDVYVLSSDAYEGWGAVVNEALEEGMEVIGTREAGGPASILPAECLYRAGNVEELALLLKGSIPRIGIGEWTPQIAASFLQLNM